MWVSLDLCRFVYFLFLFFLLFQVWGNFLCCVEGESGDCITVLIQETEDQRALVVHSSHTISK